MTGPLESFIALLGVDYFIEQSETLIAPPFQEKYGMDLLEIISIVNLIVLSITLVVLTWQVNIQRKEMHGQREQIDIQREQMDIQRKELLDQHDWNRRAESIKYSGFFHTEVKKSRDVLNKHFNIHTRRDSIPLDDILKIINSEQKNDPEVRTAINYLLTYYENIAIACNSQIADKDIMKIMVKGSYVNFRTQISKYINWRRDEAINQTLWSNFTDLAGEWESAGTKISVLPRTGSL